MIQSFADKEYLSFFFDSLLKSERFSDESRIRGDMLEYFKSKTDLFLDSDFETILNKFDSPIRAVLMTLINQMTTGRKGTKVVSNQKKVFDKFLGNKKISKKLESPFSVFWLGNTYRFKIDEYRKNNPFYFLSVKNDLTYWKSFSKSKIYYVGAGTGVNDSDCFDSWDNLKDFSHPLEDIIISDSYAFGDKTGIIENIIPLISGLISDNSHLKNIIIFTKKENTINNSLIDLHDLIQRQLSLLNIKANIQIYSSHKNPHGRYVITNNVFIEFGNSFDFFDRNRELKSKSKLNDSSINIMPIYDANKAQLNNILKWLKEVMVNSDNEMFYGKPQKNMLDMI